MANFEEKRSAAAAHLRLDAAATTALRDAVQMQGWHALALLVCGVRLSTEKNPLLFARVLERLAPELASRVLGAASPDEGSRGTPDLLAGGRLPVLALATSCVAPFAGPRSAAAC